MDIAIIPAYNPDEQLIKLVSKLREIGIKKIIVVNDGSDNEKLKIFNQLGSFVTLLTHEINRGKGAAIKTALNYIVNNISDVQAVVILDADGQHNPEDAARLLKAVHQKDSGLVLGVRQLKCNIQFCTLCGNTRPTYVFDVCYVNVFLRNTKMKTAHSIQTSLQQMDVLEK